MPHKAKKRGTPEALAAGAVGRLVGRIVFKETGKLPERDRPYSNTRLFVGCKRESSSPERGPGETVFELEDAKAGASVNW